MKIQVLLELIDTNVETKSYRGEFHGNNTGNSRSSNKEIGSGVYSKVRNDPNDPHMVQKRHRDPKAASTDGFVKWADYLINNKLVDTNPHFPRIYNARKIEDSEGKNIYKYQIEKLVSAEDVSPKILEAIWRQNFTQYSMPEDIEELDAEDIADTMSGIISMAVEGNSEYMDDIISDSLKEAVKHLRAYYAETNYNALPDLHSGNIMLRRTPHGIQLVITDPFA